MTLSSQPHRQRVSQTKTEAATYWYHYSPKSMGFAPSSSVSLNSADTTDGPSKTRLSWHFGSSGYRAGSTTDPTANLYMVVLYCNDLS